MFTETMTQALALADVFNSATTSNNTMNSSQTLDMSKFKRAFYAVYISSVASGQVNFQLQSAPATNFATAHNIAGTLTNNFNASNNSQWVTLEVRSDEVVSANAGDRYVRLSAQSNGNTTFIALGLGGESMQGPASQYNLNSSFIAQQVLSTV